MSPTWGLRQTFTWELPGKLEGLVYIIEVYSHGAAFFFTAAIAFAIGWATRHRAVRFHAVGVGLLVIGIAVYMALPRVVFETYMADQRLPISLAFMLIACIDLDMRHRIVRRGFAAVLVVMLGIRVAEVESMWGSLSVGTESFRQSVQLIDRGAKVLVAYADPDGGDDVHDLGLVHAACFAIIERSALVTTAFTVVGKQIMHARPEYRARVDTVDGTPPMINELVHLAHSDDRPERKLLAALDQGLRLPLRAVRRRQPREPRSGAPDHAVHRRPVRALSDRPVADRRRRKDREIERRPIRINGIGFLSISGIMLIGWSIQARWVTHFWP